MPQSMNAWAPSEQTLPSKYNAHVTLTLRTILHVDGETTLWITTTSHPYCCQLNQRYTTCYMEQPHNCNEQLVANTSSPAPLITVSRLFCKLVLPFYLSEGKSCHQTILSRLFMAAEILAVRCSCVAVPL